MIKISSQDDLDELLQLPHWEDAFIKEWYAFSPSFVTAKKEVVVADANPTMLIHIFSPEVEHQSLEMVFQNVEDISIFFNTDFEPHGRFQHDRIFSHLMVTKILLKLSFYVIAF